MKVTKSEKDLILAMGEVGYGQILDAELPIKKESENYDLDISGKSRSLIEYLREEEIHELDSITVHQGLPTQIEVQGFAQGFKYKKKVNL
jgi:hypothetical protein